MGEVGGFLPSFLDVKILKKIGMLKITILRYTPSGVCGVIGRYVGFVSAAVQHNAIRLLRLQRRL